MSKIMIRKVRQKEKHCGPASLEMLCSFYGLDISQETIAQASGISETIRISGSRIDQLNVGMRALLADYALLAKYDASIDDLRLLTATFGLPVGVEWRGRFIDPDGKYFEDGHYCVITALDEDDEHGSLTMADPEANTAFREGAIRIQEFLARWWEVNEIPALNGAAGTEPIRNDRLLFVLVPTVRVADLAPLGLAPVSLGLMRKHRSAVKINGNHANGLLNYHPYVMQADPLASGVLHESD